MTIAQDEIFGLMVVVISFSDEDEATSIVNESKYGLTSAVYTQNMERALRCSRRIDAGVVFLNNYYRQFLGTPFGGFKESGYGREHFIETLREWSRTENVRTLSGQGKVPAWRGVVDIYGEKGSELV